MVVDACATHGPCCGSSSGCSSGSSSGSQGPRQRQGRRSSIAKVALLCAAPLGTSAAGTGGVVASETAGRRAVVFERGAKEAAEEPAASTTRTTTVNGNGVSLDDCEDSDPHWTDGDASCLNASKVYPECTDRGVTCRYYWHPEVYYHCRGGSNEPWRHCCVCGGGTMFTPANVPMTHTTTALILRLPRVPGEPAWMQDTLNKNLGKLDQKVQKSFNPVKSLTREVYKGLNADDYEAPPSLGGGTVDEINKVVLQVLASVVVATGVGAVMDVIRVCPPRKGRPRWWAMLLLATSYSLLWPGLVSTVFSFDIVVNIFGNRIDVQPEREHSNSCTESVLGLIQLLQDTGSPLGALMVLVYACVVPAAKLVLLFLGELLRFSDSQCLVKFARFCVKVVQAISKWASPDMFAYVLLGHLVRVLNHPPTILSDARLDSGFSCFAVFCVCSTISSLGISLPVLESDNDQTLQGCWGPPLLARCASKSNLVFVAAGLTALFVVLLWFGLIEPCMSLYINEQQLYKPNGSLPYDAKPVVDALEIPSLLSSDVSIWSCIKKLLDEMGSGEANCVFGLVLLAIFVIGLTVLDMLMLIGAAWHLRLEGGSGGLCDLLLHAGFSSRTAQRTGKLGDLQGCPLLAVAKVANKLSMLDVSIMGIYVMTVCLSMYQQYGIIVSMERGVALLLCAEVVHAATHWMVAAAVEHHLASDRKVGSPCELRELVAAGSRTEACDFYDPSVPVAAQAGCCGSTRRSLLKSPFGRPSQP